MSNKEIAIPASHAGEESISLPIKRKDLGNFISGLLGQQQSIERELNEQFDIDHLWVINLHEILNQRIHQQADANLTSFSATIYFATGLKRSFTTVDSFKAYSETKKEIPIGIKVIWDYLVQFPGKNYPEKQQITFSAHIHPEEKGKKNLNRNKLNFESVLLRSITDRTERSAINYQINHTERTWGDDIETIISNQVDEVIRTDQLLGKLFDVSRLFFAMGIILFGMFYPLYSNILSISDSMNNVVNSYKSIEVSSQVSTEIINAKMDKVVDMIQLIGNKDKKAGFAILLITASFISAILFLKFTKKGNHSFLIFSKEAEKNRLRKLKQERTSGLVLIGSFFIAVLSGIIANYGYAWISAM